MFNQEQKNIYIYWADGLQELMKNILLELRSENNNYKVFVLCLNQLRASEAFKWVDGETVLIAPTNFEYDKCSSGVKMVLEEWGSTIAFSERHFYSQKEFLSSIYECDSSKSIGVDLVMRAAYFCSFMEANGGVLLSECRSDILSSMAALLKEHTRNFYNLTPQATRLFSENEDVFFQVGYDFEAPMHLKTCKSQEDSEYIEQILTRTINLFKSRITADDVYKSNPKKIIHQDITVQYKNTKKVIFFPLQYFPENATLGDCLGSVDQIWVVNHLARSLPYDAELWIKDHFVHTEKDGNRLNALKNIPNLRIISNSESASDILRDVDLVVTQSSSVGVEAIYRGVPVICFGSPIYKAHPLVSQLNILGLSTKDLRKKILEAIELTKIVSNQVAEEFMDNLFREHANSSYVSKRSDGLYPYTNVVAKAMVRGVNEIFSLP